MKTTKMYWKNKPYKWFLYSIIGNKEVLNSNYFDVFRRTIDYLYNKEFVWVVQDDENRAKVGLELRDKFVEFGGILGSDVPEKCTYLEMFIGLAKQIAEHFVYYEGEPGPYIAKWFWFLLDSYGFLCEDDKAFETYFGSKLEANMGVFETFLWARKNEVSKKSKHGENLWSDVNQKIAKLV